MKKVLLIALAALMLFSFAACAGGNDDPTDHVTTAPTELTEPSEPAPVLEAVTPEQKDGVYQLSEPGHLLFLAANPEKDYVMCADIDMGGYAWTPVDTFSGSLSGKISDLYNYTISNLTIQAAAGDTNVGLFRVLTGTVKEINFENITVTADGTFSGNLGVVAGQSDSKLTDVYVKSCTVTATAKDANIGMLTGKNTKGITDCFASGALKVTMAGGTCNVGGAVGVADNMLMDVEVRVDLDVSGTGTLGAAGGIAGVLNNVARNLNFGGTLKVNTDASYAAGTIVGDLTKGGMLTVLNCAADVQIIGATAKDAYLGKVADNVSVSDCWTRDFSKTTMSDAELALRQQVVDYMYRSCTIRWIPSKDMSYTDDCANNSGRHNQTYHAGQTYFGLPYTHKTGSLERFEHYLNADGTVKDTVPSTGWDGLLGNDCNDAVYWSWATISGSIDFLYTGVTICQGGTIPVGGYTVTPGYDTTQICSANGEQAMYEAYACLKLGDAVLYAPGHIRMVAENAYVFRNPDGTINPDKSYILTHEQGGSFNDKQEARKSTCLTNYKYTFAKLFSTNYIPITIEAFANGKEDELVISTTNTDTTKAGVAKGTVTANYRLNYVKLQITDASGVKVVDAFYSPDVRDVHVNSLDLSTFQKDVTDAKLVAGQEYTYTVLYGYGDDEAVVQTFKFTA